MNTKITKIVEACKSPNWRAYQSIFRNGEMLYRGGRAEELVQRFDMIFISDILGKEIVDIGCNLGSMCFMAVEHGAKKAYGFDIEQGLVDTATELAKELNLNCEFKVADYGKPQPKIGDTAFCFAVDAYVDTEVLAQTLSQYDVVYFETHGNRTNAAPYDIPDEVKREFPHQQYLGTVGTNAKKTYRLTK